MSCVGRSILRERFNWFGGMRLKKEDATARADFSDTSYIRPLVRQMRGGVLSMRGEAARYSIYIFELYRPYSFLLTAFILSAKRRETKEKGFGFII